MLENAYQSCKIKSIKINCIIAQENLHKPGFHTTRRVIRIITKPDHKQLNDALFMTSKHYTTFSMNIFYHHLQYVFKEMEQESY